jgi:hypothetical protein
MANDRFADGLKKACGWTVETLREFVLNLVDSHDSKLNQRISDLDVRLSQCLLGYQKNLEFQVQALKEATIIAKSELGLRLESMNEFRSQLKDQAAQFVTTTSFGAHVKAADMEFREMRIEIEKTKGILNSLSASFTSASNSLERRLDTMNEFRGQLKDQSAGFFTRNEHEQYSKTIDVDVRSLRESRAAIEGKASQTHLFITFAISVLGLLVAIASIAHSVWVK